MSMASRCHKLAEKLGYEIEVDRDHHTIQIVLPTGWQITGNNGLNRLVNASETMAQAWDSTMQDLKTYATDIELMPQSVLDDYGIEPHEVVRR